MTAWHRAWIMLGTCASTRLQDVLWPIPAGHDVPWWFHALVLAIALVGVWRTI